MKAWKASAVLGVLVFFMPFYSYAAITSSNVSTPIVYSDDVNGHDGIGVISFSADDVDAAGGTAYWYSDSSCSNFIGYGYDILQDVTAGPIFLALLSVPENTNVGCLKVDLYTSLNIFIDTYTIISGDSLIQYLPITTTLVSTSTTDEIFDMQFLSFTSILLGIIFLIGTIWTWNLLTRY